jgi:general secretion pathway protein G
MKKKGFSLVELLIVLAVIAALIATITPVAMNAIKKSKATKVAQNLKTLANSFMNSVMVNNEAPESLSSLGRDIDTNKYALYYNEDQGTYRVIVVTIEEVDFQEVRKLLPEAVSNDGLNDLQINKLANSGSRGNGTVQVMFVPDGELRNVNDGELIRTYININDSDPDNSDYASPLEDIGNSEVQKIYYGFVFTIA